MSEVIRFDLPDEINVKRADELLARMTLAEKVGQLVQQSPFRMVDWAAILEKRAQAEILGRPFSLHDEVTPEFEAHIREGRTGTVMCTDPQVTNYLQHLAVDGSRLHIPLLVAADVIHGFRTIFPIPLAESCTWDEELIEQAERIAAEEASACGVNWIFAPMVDIARDPRWGRIAEGSGEDPVLGAAVARARVRGFQSARLKSGRRIAACPKHYVAYGAAEGGRDYNTTEVTERALRDIYLPPFKAAFAAGAGSTMSAFNEIGGVPASANAFTLRTILREEWGWPGVVVSDYNAVGELIEHGVASDLQEAARLAILAGVDIDMESGAYARHLAALVEAGSVPIELVDGAVRRVLRLKFALGLFENPYVDEALARKTILQDYFRRHALEVARRSMVLLKNESGLLPLEPGLRRLALIGPLADDPANMLGTWPGEGRAADADSLLSGIRTYLPASRIIYEKGCPISGIGPCDFSRAIAAAEQSDVVVLAVGESADLSGEAHSRAYLGLPGHQQELVEAIVATGKPVVAVVLCGRPLAIPYLDHRMDALLVAWHSGIRTGQAAADILFGAVNPSGRLSASWPRTEGQIPIYYAHKNTGRPTDGPGTTQFVQPFRSNYSDEANTPQFPFGFGLSYTRFEYADLKVETPAVAQDGALVVSLKVRNAGSREGTETVQLYVHDRVASFARPVKELKGFQRLSLAPGEARLVRFEVPAHELGFHGHENRYRVEPGRFTVWVGPDALGGLEAEFEVG